MSEKTDTSDEQVVNVFTAEAIDNLTEGFLNALQPEVLRVEQSLNELISNQDEMLTSIQTKRSQFEDPTLSKDITSLLSNVPVYKQKLSTINKNMIILDKRIKKLQLRATRLKELKMNKEAQNKKELEKRMEEEKMLEAKPSK